VEKYAGVECGVKGQKRNDVRAFRGLFGEMGKRILYMEEQRETGGKWPDIP